MKELAEAFNYDYIVRYGSIGIGTMLMAISSKLCHLGEPYTVYLLIPWQDD